MWYVLSIHSSKQRKVNEELRELGIRRFYPMRTSWRKQRSGPRKRIETPLFPAYLFVGFSFRSTSARSILSIDGVRRFLGVEGVPQRIRDREVTRMRAAINAGDYDETRRILAHALVGTTAFIAEGTFAGHHAIVADVTDNVATLNVSILGKAVAVKINVDSLN